MPSKRAPTKLPTTEPTAIAAHEAAVGRQHGKAPVAAVAREADEHGRQADGERQASGQLHVGTEQQDQRRDQQLAAGDAEQRGDDADREAGDQPGDDLRQPVNSAWPTLSASWPTSRITAMPINSTAITR